MTYDVKRIDIQQLFPYANQQELMPPSAVENIPFDKRLIIDHFYIHLVCDWYIYAGEAVPMYLSKTYDGIIKNDIRFHGLCKAKTAFKCCFYLSEFYLYRHPKEDDLLVKQDKRWWPTPISKLDL